jgi:hypothetical protein
MFGVLKGPSGAMKPAERQQWMGVKYSGLLGFSPWLQKYDKCSNFENQIKLFISKIMFIFSALH